jgi:hypothetical protein
MIKSKFYIMLSFNRTVDDVIKNRTEWLEVNLNAHDLEGIVEMINYDYEYNENKKNNLCYKNDCHLIFVIKLNDWVSSILEKNKLKENWSIEIDVILAYTIETLARCPLSILKKMPMQMYFNVENEIKKLKEKSYDFI